MAKVERRSGSYSVRVSVRDPASGQRVQRRVTARTKRELDILVTQLKAKSQRGEDITPNQTPLIEWMREWHASYKRSPSSQHDRRRAYEIHVADHPIAQRPIGTLQPVHIQAWVNELAATLNPYTVRGVFAAVRMALRRAYALRIIPHDPTQGVEMPPIRKHQPVILSREQARHLIDDTAGDEYHAFWVLAVTLGIRRGELLGLRWGDIDLTAGTLTIARTMTRDAQGIAMIGEVPKTAGGHRTIPLPAACRAALTIHQDHWEERRRTAGDLWHADGAVFDRGLGEHWGNSTEIWRVFTRMKARIGLPGDLRLHDLRHSAAVSMIRAGIPIPIISKILGHADPSITLRIYLNATAEMMDEAVASLDTMYDVATGQCDQNVTMNGNEGGHAYQHKETGDE